MLVSGLCPGFQPRSRQAAPWRVSRPSCTPQSTRARRSACARATRRSVDTLGWTSSPRSRRAEERARWWLWVGAACARASARRARLTRPPARTRAPGPRPRKPALRHLCTASDHETLNRSAPTTMPSTELRRANRRRARKIGAIEVHHRRISGCREQPPAIEQDHQTAGVALNLEPVAHAGGQRQPAQFV